MAEGLRAGFEAGLAAERSAAFIWDIGFTGTGLNVQTRRHTMHPSGRTMDLDGVWAGYD